MGLLDPRNLLWAFSIAILLAIYLRSRSRPMLEVSSLLLLDEAPAPVARVRHLRIDQLFWLETAVLGALALALAGLYFRTGAVTAQGRNRALVFDLAAGMSAREDGGSRLDAAKKAALAIVDAAPERDQFSVIGYALEGQMIHPETSNRKALHRAIAGIQPMAVGARRVAQSAALMRARAAGEVDFFADRKPPLSIIADSGLGSHFRFHQSGTPADNLAIVSLDPGIPTSSPGRVALKNFGRKPKAFELAIEGGGKTVFHQSLILGPGEQAIAPFGPLTSGGLVHAQILTADALDADNDRYAYAPIERAAHVVVLSPAAAVREDLARVLLAVNSNFIITMADPRNSTGDDEYSLAVMHDCYVAGLKTQSTLLIFPPAGVSGVEGLRVTGRVPAAQMTAPGGDSAISNPTFLDSTRVLIAPEWMNVRASGTAAGSHETLMLAAFGANSVGNLGLLAFDVRDHLLLDPDRLDALLTTVDLVRELTAPKHLRIVSTGAFLAVPASPDAKVIAPDGTTLRVSRDRWERLRIHPMLAGHYSVESATEKTDIYSNYYDAAESDLTSIAPPSPPQPIKSALATLTAPKQVEPLSAVLITFALLAIILESVLLARNARRWGVRHV